jgi:endonuclease/exonuclease/phosphatase family metal-dependent hydrolase
LRVLSWNLFHGRSVPPCGRDLEGEFARALASWPWDVALLQEVPPWWSPTLARTAGAEQRTALTSRNSLPGLRRAIARRWPDAIKSNAGGANAILSRRALLEDRSVRLRRRPERRVAQLARIEPGVVVANFHGSARVPLAEQELARLWSLALDLAGGSPLILGGDLNLRAPLALVPGARHVGARDVDHIFCVGLSPRDEAQVLAPKLENGAALSDHPPLLVELL